MSKITEAKKAQYLAEIRSWNWDKIKAHAQDNPSSNDESINGSTLIGSIYGPISNKYYLPFACSNVDDCPHCGGSGKVRNLNHDPEQFKYWDECQHLFRMKLVEGGPPQTWAERDKATLSTMVEFRDSFTESDQCPYCDGLGSEEACSDEIYLEALDEVADENGGWIECEDDRFFVMNLGSMDDDVFFADPGFDYCGERVAETEDELRAWMEVEGYSPNVWWIFDHGNIRRYSWDT